MTLTVGIRFQIADHLFARRRIPRYAKGTSLLGAL